MFTITVEGSDRFQDAFIQLGGKVEDLTWLWPEMAGVFYQRELKLFTNEGEGEWLPLTPRYATWKAKHYPGEPLLSVTGRLRRSLVSRDTPESVYEADARSLTVGTIVPYAVYHQAGTSRMVRRPPIIIDDETERYMIQFAGALFEKQAGALGFITKYF
jgi:phage gpG-like protein